MYLAAVKLGRVLFWSALATGILALLFKDQVPLALPLGLALAWGGVVLLAILHVQRTRRRELRCPNCGWTPFALNAWKCRECKFVWDVFGTDGVCPRCDHEHEEAACVRCRRIARRQDWRVGK